VMPLLLF